MNKKNVRKILAGSLCLALGLTGCTTGAAEVKTETADAAELEAETEEIIWAGDTDGDPTESLEALTASAEEANEIIWAGDTDGDTTEYVAMLYSLEAAVTETEAEVKTEAETETAEKAETTTGASADGSSGAGSESSNSSSNNPSTSSKSSSSSSSETKTETTCAHSLYLTGAYDIYNCTVEYECEWCGEIIEADVKFDTDGGAEALKLINEYRAAAGLTEFTSDSDLTTLARARATECIISLGHSRPDGTSSTCTAMELGTANAAGLQFYGECLAAYAITAEDVVESWKESSGHWAIIMREDACVAEVLHAYTDYSYTIWIFVEGNYDEYFGMD